MKKNYCAFTLAKSATSYRKTAFTLAEVLITLGVIGVVAALTLPTVMSNIQDRVKKEQVRNFKYKLTQATDKMKSLGLIGMYGDTTTATEEFVKELQKHYKLSKVCQNDNLRACWPTDKIITPDEEKSVSTLTTGEKISALALGTKNTKTMGIVTADGVSAILVYSPVCNALDAEKTYIWSTIDGKPETNATTNCISAIFDINGRQKPNRLGADVRTLNSIFGFKRFSAIAGNQADCNALKRKGLVQYCNGTYTQNGTDYWVGAMKACDDLGLHLPSMQTLANIAGARYGRTDISVNTLILKNDYTDDSYPVSTGNCLDYYKAVGSYRLATSNVICVDGNIPTDSGSAVSGLGDVNFWSAVEVSATTAQRRDIHSHSSSWHADNRKHNNAEPLCLGD